MPSEEKPTSSIRSATQKATVRPVEKRRVTLRLSAGTNDAPDAVRASSSNLPPTMQQPLEAHFTPASHLPLELTTQPVIRTMTEPLSFDDETLDRSPYATSELLPSEDDADYMELENTPTPVRIQNPPILVTAARGLPGAPSLVATHRASRLTASVHAPISTTSALIPAPTQQSHHDQLAPQPQQPEPIVAQPATNAIPAATYAAITAREPAPLPPTIAPPALPPAANHTPPAIPEQDQPMAGPPAHPAITQADPPMPIDAPPVAPPMQPVHLPAPLPAVIPPPVPPPGGLQAPINPQLAAFLNFVEEDLLAVSTHTGPQEANQNGSLASFTAPPPGGFPRTYRTSNTVLVRNITPTQLITIFGQPNPVLIVLPYNWNGRDLLTRGAEAAAHIRTVAIEYSRAVSAADPEVITVTTPTPVHAASPETPSPPVFFLRNLPNTTLLSMINRGVISHPQASFQVFPIPTPEPTHSIICAMDGFTTDDTAALTSDISDTLRLPSAHIIICEIIRRYFLGTHDQLADLADTFARSISLIRIPLHAPGGMPIPRYVMLGDRPTGISNAIWYQLREALFQQLYETPLHGTGFPVRFGSCSLCHCITHPRGLCPFSAIDGWNGPTYDNTWVTQEEPNTTHFAQQSRGRGQGRARGPNRARGRGQRGRGRGGGMGGMGPGPPRPPPPPPPATPTVLAA
ncbi:hypothetical protein NEOLEDRAFT_1183859 [Neolentinus lepideus HHB14362 ss-1]|uniref:Uncharacterized protein n=1 Tax=Neolentinus lepideus HHB14362 ss-1 TaxID=1314782 RepID=A0A165MX78_9AGAM|nr:hypothetical protein NEOLEDRAFT_1183859 [Neolentinus lepideus HHB14362 ss-1]